MPANTLAIFAVKAPVEPTAPNQNRLDDTGSDFKDFMDTAANKVDTKSSKENPSQNQNDTQAEKTQSHKTKPDEKTASTEENSNYQKVSEENKAQSTSDSVTKDTEDNEVLVAQLQELGIDQTQYESMLSLFGLDGDADLDTLLQSIVQGLNLNQNDLSEGTIQSDLIAKTQQNEGEAVNLLKQAGLSDAEAKKFLDNLQSLKNINVQAKINSQTNPSDSENSQNENDEGPDFLTQFKEPAKETTSSPDKGTAKSKLPASANERAETPKQSAAPRITTQEPVSESSNKTSSLGELLNDKNAQANIIQTESFADAKSFKGLETTKTGPDLQLQSPSVAANTAVKAMESSKPILPENLLARGATEAKIINQLADKMTVRTNGAQNEVQVRLDPPSLGKVRMNITTSGDSVRATIVAENPAVKQVIENNFNQLRDAMGEQGLKLDSFTVTVGGESANQNPSGQASGEENTPFDQTASNETEMSQANEPVALFFGDNQSISVIA